MKRTFHRNGLAIALLSCQLPGVLFAQQGATYTDIAASARSPIGQGRLNEAATESVRPIQLDRSRREAWAMVGIAYGKRTNPEDCRHEVPFCRGRCGGRLRRTSLLLKSHCGTAPPPSRARP